MSSFFNKHKWLIAPLGSIFAVILTFLVGWTSLQASVANSIKTIESHEQKVRQLEIQQAEVNTSLRHILNSLERIEDKIDKKADK